jgi:hypothetical protein
VMRPCATPVPRATGSVCRILPTAGRVLFRDRRERGRGRANGSKGIDSRIKSHSNYIYHKMRYIPDIQK